MQRLNTASSYGVDLFATFDESMHQFEPFERAPHVAVAVSGGADSMCLALLAQTWVQQHNGRVSALIVDHGLRNESGQEALQVKAWLAAHNIDAHILPIQLTADKAAIQERARDARYSAMAQWCQDNSVLHLLLGHHQDDQAETSLFRLMRGSGMLGVAGMSVVREMRGCRLLRPLMPFSKQDCVSYLQAIGQSWVEDPSNKNPAYSRTVFRRLLAGVSDRQLSRLQNVIGGLGRYRIGQEQALAASLVHSVTMYDEGVAKIDSTEALSDVLLPVLVCVNGAAGRPRSNEIERLCAQLESDDSVKATLHGCVIDKRESGAIWVYRELNAVQPPVEIQEISTYWDRFWLKVNADELDSGYSLGALGQDGWLQAKGECQLPPHIKPSMSYALPAIWHLEELQAVPHIGYYSEQWRFKQPSISFSPAKALAGAPFSAMNDMSNK